MTGQQFYQDAAVHDAADEKIGTIQAYDPDGGYLVVQKGFLFHKDLYIPVTAVQNTDAAGTVHLRLYKDDLADDQYANPPAGGASGDDSYAQRTTMAETTTTRVEATPQPMPRQSQPTAQTGDNINVPVYEEELVAGTRQAQIGDIHLHKDVVEEQATANVSLSQEQVTVERVPFTGQTNETDLKNAFQDQDIEVPVMGEKAVVDKQSHVVEEVRLHKQDITEQQQVSDTVRKERVSVEGADEADTRQGQQLPRGNQR